MTDRCDDGWTVLAKLTGKRYFPVVEPTDVLIAARLAAGDDHALTEVFDRLAPSVYGAALQVLRQGAAAQDVVQDVFVELWSNPGKFDPAVGKLGAYLVMRARHRAVDIVRSEVRRLARQERLSRMTPDVALRSPGDELAEADAAAAVRAAVQQLPADQRQVIELAYFKGMSYREVACAVGIPEGTAKSRLRLALGKLEAVLDKQLLES